jgi:hypothetical protein
MKFMVKTVTKLAEKLKEEFGDRLNIVELNDGTGKMLAIFDDIPLEVVYRYGKYLKVSVLPDNRELLEYLRPTFRELTNNFRIHFGFDCYSDGVHTANLMWHFSDPVGFRERLLSSNKYFNEILYNGGLKGIPSLMAKRNKLFDPLPKEQQITENGLLALERRIAAASRKNEEMLRLSLEYADSSKPCESDGPIEDSDPEKQLTKK